MSSMKKQKDERRCSIKKGMANRRQAGKFSNKPPKGKTFIS